MMKICRFALMIMVAASLDLCAVEPKDVAGRQIELCMIGDSITWAQEGDYFRKHLVAKVPNMAFVGVHTAKYGYSHAGEGGNRTGNVLARLNDVNNIPDCRYYHLLIGINDSNSAKNDEDVPRISRGTADRILQIIEGLLARKCTEKVFWGTILPAASVKNAKPEAVEHMKYRDKAGSATNVILRKEIPERFGDKVVIIEYEKPLRARPDWPEIIVLHPTPFGYDVVTDITAEYIRKYATPANAPLENFGVEVTNLWNDEEKCTSPLIAGWYVLSFEVQADAPEVKLTLKSRNPEKLKSPLNMTFTMKGPFKAGQRAEVMFMTGYEGYKYNKSSLEITECSVGYSNVMMEKMRPSMKASIYGKGTFVDSASPMALGELFVPVK